MNGSGHDSTSLLGSSGPSVKNLHKEETPPGSMKVVETTYGAIPQVATAAADHHHHDHGAVELPPPPPPQQLPQAAVDATTSATTTVVSTAKEDKDEELEEGNNNNAEFSSDNNDAVHDAALSVLESSGPAVNIRLEETTLGSMEVVDTKTAAIPQVATTITTTTTGNDEDDNDKNKVYVVADEMPLGDDVDDPTCTKLQQPEQPPPPPVVLFEQPSSSATKAAAAEAGDAPYRWKKGHLPESEAWLFSRLFFIWVGPLFRRAAYLHRQGKGLEQDDLLPLPLMDHGHVVGSTFERAWEHEQAKAAAQRAAAAAAATATGGSPQSPAAPALKLSELKGAQGRSTTKFRRAVGAVIGWPFWFAGLLKMVNTGIQFSFPLLLNAILSFIEDSQAGRIPENAPWQDVYRGYWLSALLFVAMASKAVTENTYFQKVIRAGYQSRVAISVAVYNKALRLANTERQETTLGELINLMQVDATKIEMFVPQVHVLWDGLLQITGYMTILYTLIGWPCFAGLILMVAAGPIQGVIMKKMFGENHKMAKFTDKRVKKINEALQGIQCVKMYTWEESFEQQISQCRNGELSHMSVIAYLRAFSRSYMSALPGLVAVTSFVVYALVVPDANVSASTLFAALAAFDQLRFPLLFYPMALAQLSQAQVSAARIETFLNMKEVATNEGEQATGNGTYTRIADDKNNNNNQRGGEIHVNKATIYWSDPNIPIPKGGNNSDGDDTSSVSSKSTVSSKKSSRRSLSTAQAEEEEDDEESRLLSGELVYPKPVLEDVNFKVQPGQMCAVVGRVGSGKSTVCSAVLNETILGSGNITLTGKVAYAAQSPWILNASLRDNILFGLPMDQEKYQRVLQACQLSYDLELLEQGDMTEIGEKGINLSGGQKARVSVARAAYSDADTIILDDPLSALDPEVGKKLFDECVVKLMRGKTRLLVTNQLQFLQNCDTIVALGKGRMLEQGTFDDLNAKDGGEVQRILHELAAGRESMRKSTKESKRDKKKKSTNDEAKKEPTGPPVQGQQENKGLVTKEERNVGAVAAAVYRKYMVAGGGYLKFFIVYFAFVLSAANNLAGVSWISFWTSDADYENFSQGFYLGMYGLIAITLGVFTYARTYLIVRFGIHASEVLHKNLLGSILNAPQSFFDTTPIGRIISRFSKDIYSIDIELGENLDFFLFMSMQVFVSMGTIIFVTPWFSIAVVPLGVVYFKVLNYFRDVSRETKRLESVSRSPVYAQFSESLGGLGTIRAYGQSERFMGEFENKVDENIRAWYCNKNADRWLSVRLEIIGACIAGLAAFFASNVAISGAVSGQDSDSNFASMAGLSLTFAISVTSLLNWCVRTFAQLEASMNACERVLYYTEEIPQEAPRTTKELEEYANSCNPSASSNPAAFAVVAKGGKAETFSEKWPEIGAITLEGLKMKYRKDTPLVLKGLSVSIAGGERIGVVGRTGSGKSSLLLTLLRLVEPTLEDDKSNYNAPLSIDGVDTLRIGLRDLRSKLGIIPQNPVLFSGTIRTNIDPFDEYSDDQIWAALERCGMKAKVEEMPGMLAATVSEYGENLSAGMRQMLVLGRALLRNNRILLLDEATSSVDYETDKEIQRTIREAFQGCTILIIAHRINTIMDSDKILVMKDGQAAEFAPPQELLKDENSLFADIVRHSQSDESH